MKLQLLTAVATAALMVTPSLAAAQDDAGWYVKAQAGYGTHTDINFTGDDLIGDVESEGGAVWAGGVGYDFGENWRLEGDISSLHTSLGQISQLPGSDAGIRTNTATLNAFYDFTDFGKFQPYVGAGIGFARAQLDATAHDFLAAPNVGPLISSPACTPSNTTVSSCNFDDSDSTIVWQLMAGLGVAITENLIWDTQYRYQNLTDLDFTGFDTTFGANAGVTSAIATTADSVGSHNLLSGFRYKFGAPAAPVVAPPPAPAPVAPPPPPEFTCWNGTTVTGSEANCPARPQVTCWDNTVVSDASQCSPQPRYTCEDGSIVSDQAICESIRIAALCEQPVRQEIIYYEFDRGQSAETRQKIQNILDTGQFCAVDSIRVVGHTDSSGSAAYNQNLSEKRAKDVLNELVRQGIDSNVISSEGRGESQPFIDRGDGVKEQLNRRTEVLINLSEVGRIN